MLQAIRSKTASIVVKALAGLLIVSFAAWGVEDFISARATETAVATVGDRDIDPLALEYQLDSEVARLRQAFGGRLNEQQLAGLGIGQAVLDRLINDATMALKSEELGIKVSDDQVTRAIHVDPTFRGFDGNFSRQRFNEVMRANGMTEAGYIQQVRADLANSQLLQAIGEADAAPKRMATLLRAYRFETRSADTVLVAASAQPAPGAPTDAQLAEVHQAQKERFTAPEYRKLTVVHLDPDALKDGIAVNDDELQKAYDAHLGQFQKPEQRTVQQIVVTDETKARAIVEKLKTGADFMTVAKEDAEMEEAAVNLGTVTETGLLPDLAAAVFAVAPGAVTDAIKSPLGYHILKAVDVTPGENKSLDQVRDEVTEIVRRDKAVEALYDLSIRFEDEIGGGATLEEAGQSVGIPAIKVDAVDRNGKTPSGADAAGLPALASLLPVAFSTDQGIESPLTEAGDKGFFMVRVDDVIAPALRPLESIRDEVAAVWAEEQREESALAQAKQLAERVRNGTPLADIAGELGAVVETVGPLTRRERAKAETAVVGQMFEIDPGSAGIAKVDAGYRVIKVTDVSAAGANGVEAPSADEMNTQLDQTVANDLAVQAINAMRNDYGVSINKRVFDKVLEPGTFDPRQPG